MKQALAGTLSPESRKRIERLLAAQDHPSADYLRMARTVEAMEAAGSPEAIKLLEHWSSGAARTLFTRDAQAPLKRLAARK